MTDPDERMNELIRASAGHTPDPGGELEESDGQRARREIAAAHGLPAEIAERLRGANTRELGQDAAALAAGLRTAGVAFSDPPDPPAHVSLDGGTREIVPQSPSFSSILRAEMESRRFGAKPEVLGRAAQLDRDNP